MKNHTFSRPKKENSFPLWLRLSETKDFYTEQNEKAEGRPVLKKKQQKQLSFMVA